MSVAAGMRPGVADSVGLAGRQVVASYATYGPAQSAVDHLSDSAFPVEHAAIVGRDLSLVEQVVAARYDVTVTDGYAVPARKRLSSLG